MGLAWLTKGDYFSKIFLTARFVQAVSCIVLMGLVGNLIHLTNASHHSAPAILLGNLGTAAATAFWLLLSVTQHKDTHLAYYVTGAVDATFIIPWAVFAIVLGLPVATNLASCSSLPTLAEFNNSTNTASNGGNATLNSAFPVVGGNSSFLSSSSVFDVPTNNYLQLSGVDPPSICLELNAVMGLTIAMASAFVISSTFTFMKWVGKRRAEKGAAGSDAESWVGKQ
jgi:hypothetical protein